MKSKYRGFTLIELLVVISIIALLASIILASLNSSLDRAHIAAGEQFADQVYHTAGDAIVGDWEFDDCPGLNAQTSDFSGNGNTGTLSGGITSSNGTPNGIGCSLSFPSSGSPYVSTMTQFFGPNNNGPQQFTLSVWFKTPSAPSAGGTIVGFGQDKLPGGNYDRQIYMGSDGKIYFGVWNGGPETVSSVSNLDDGKWHNAVGTNDGKNEYLYIDGVLQGTPLLNTAVPLSYSGYWHMGGIAGGSPWPKTSNGYFNGLVDGVRIYNKFLAP